MMIKSQARVLEGGICISEGVGQKKCAQHAFGEYGLPVRWAINPKLVRRGEAVWTGRVKASQGYADCSAAVDRGATHCPAG
jgi:hypothetical protein